MTEPVNETMKLAQSLISVGGTGAMWSAVAVLVTKLIDRRSALKKARTEELAEINSAHANLNKSLQGSIDALSRELTRLREEGEEFRALMEAQLARRAARIIELESEVAVLRQRLAELGEAPPPPPVHTPPPSHDD